MSVAFPTPSLPTQLSQEAIVRIDNLEYDTLRLLFDLDVCKAISSSGARNAFVDFLRTDTVLKGKAIKQGWLREREEYIQQLRAVSAAHTFLALQQALGPRILQKAFVEPSKTKVISLVIFIALTLELVLDSGGNPGTISSAKDTTYDNMYGHLTELLAHYLLYITARVFPATPALQAALSNSNGRVSISPEFWSLLEDVVYSRNSLDDPEWRYPSILTQAIPNIDQHSYLAGNAIMADYVTPLNPNTPLPNLTSKWYNIIDIVKANLRVERAHLERSSFPEREREYMFDSGVDVSHASILGNWLEGSHDRLEGATGRWSGVKGLERPLEFGDLYEARDPAVVCDGGILGW